MFGLGHHITMKAASQSEPQGMAMRFNRKSKSSIKESDFSLASMPVVVKRTLHPWSVHRATGMGTASDSNFIATLSRPHQFKVARHYQFPFVTEREARKFCKAYAPPKVAVCGNDAGYCMVCSDSLPSSARQPHCRNCGAQICNDCSTRWGTRMVPKTYLETTAATTVRVCTSCDWTSNAFCMALLQGRYEDALRLYEKANVNLRTCFADIRREALFPVHCAVMGGSIKLVRWLVDTHMCPISADSTPNGEILSVRTSNSRTLLDLAMTGKTKTDILLFLVRKGLSVYDVKDTTLATKTLQALLQEGESNQNPSSSLALSSLCEIQPTDDDSDQSVSTVLEDPCALCCEHSVNCVLVPCGHQVCCTDCGQQLSSCPICKTACSVLRIYR